MSKFWGHPIADAESGEIKYRDGAFYIKSKEELVGGWAEVYRKDYSHPIRVEVAFEEYARTTKDGKLMNNWATMPATMIRKVALVQALREAFPGEMSGMYVPEEMGIEIDEETGEVINHGEPSNGNGTANTFNTTNGKPITDAQIKKIERDAEEVWRTSSSEEISERLSQLTKSMFNKTSLEELNRKEASKLIETLGQLKRARAEEDWKSLTAEEAGDTLFE